MKRNIRHIHFRINEDHYNRINQFCNSLGISQASFFKLIIKKYFLEYDTNKILNKDSEFKKQVVYEVRRFGNNLNQIAHKLNAALFNDDITYTDKIDINKAIDDLTEIKSQIYKINDILDKRL